MPTTESQRRARDKWLNEKVETINVRVPKGKKAIIQNYAAAHGESVNGMINRLIDEELSSDTEKCKPEL